MRRPESPLSWPTGYLPGGTWTVRYENYPSHRRFETVITVPTSTLLAHRYLIGSTHSDSVVPKSFQPFVLLATAGVMSRWYLPVLLLKLLRLDARPFFLDTTLSIS